MDLGNINLKIITLVNFIQYTIVVAATTVEQNTIFGIVHLKVVALLRIFLEHLLKVLLTKKVLKLIMMRLSIESLINGSRKYSDHSENCNTSQI